MKKRVSAVLFLLFVATLLCGAGGKEYVISINEGSDAPLSITYAPDKKELFLLRFIYRGDCVKFAEKRFKGNCIECLRSLNPEITERIEAFRKANEKDVKEPQIAFRDGKFSYDFGCDGVVYDVENLCRKIVENFSSYVAVKWEPKIIFREETEGEIMARTEKISEFSTSLKTSGTNRKSNVALAASRLNDLMILPGEKLSFNAVVGERTVENGFCEAKVIKDGEFTSGVGGGVCQVSTTLFNAWLLAGLGYETAAAHSLPVSYVGASLDAMVSEGTDLVLVNDGACPVYVHARTEGDELKISIFGKPCGFEIRLRSEILEVVKGEYRTEIADLDWQEGEFERVEREPVNGLKSESYRDYYSDGKLIRSVRLRRNSYKPQNGLKYIRRSEIPEAQESEN